MQKLDGVSVSQVGDCTVCIIDSFTDEIKVLLKQQLTSICHGVSAGSGNLEMYNYPNTLRMFLDSYESKSLNIQKGMIGELLTHVLIRKLFATYQILSPFLNLEERSIKKGFDVVMFSNDDTTIWITEVKSGELHSGKNATETTETLLNNAKMDLVNRLNGPRKLYLWQNATNGARLALDDQIDMKKVVVGILNNYATAKPCFESSTDANVLLVSALFTSLGDLLDKQAVHRKTISIQQSQDFKKAFVLSLQKESFTKIHEFLKAERLQCHS